MVENASEPEPNEELLALWAKVFGFARSGQADTLAAYVDAGISANLTNDKGDTLIMLASYYGHPATVSALLHRGADPNRLNDRGQSPLAGAVFKNEPDVVRTLIEGGADPERGQPSAVETADAFENVRMRDLLRP